MVLETVQNVDIALIPEGTYGGEELYQHISQSKGVANIHFEPGIYTESPPTFDCLFEWKGGFIRRLGRAFCKRRALYSVG